MQSVVEVEGSYLASDAAIGRRTAARACGHLRPAEGAIIVIVAPDQKALLEPQELADEGVALPQVPGEGAAGGGAVQGSPLLQAHHGEEGEVGAVLQPEGPGAPQPRVWSVGGAEPLGGAGVPVERARLVRGGKARHRRPRGGREVEGRGVAVDHGPELGEGRGAP